MPATPPPAPAVPAPDPGPVGGDPIALSPATFARFEAAARYVEALSRTRTPRAGRDRRPAAPPACRGVTTGAAVPATFGGADGTIAVTVTYPDGSTDSLTAGYRSTTAGAAGKNCLLVWVPEMSMYYALVDC